MRLLRHSNTGDFSITQFPDEAIPPYAILSHTWGADTEEVTFDDLTNGTGKDKPGYEKIRFCGEQTAKNNLEYFWIDTCCINKANKAELSQAINSMFRWYRNATRCYVYLSDVSTTTLTPSRKRKWTKTARVNSEKYNSSLWESEFRKSRWFTRGWTLQELLAPCSVEFFSQDRERLGDKCSLEPLLHEITGIPRTALQGTPLSHFSVKDRYQWIHSRQTKLEEDKAYSLLGIFDVDIPLRYGEGIMSAFRRLDEEIIRLSTYLQAIRVTDARDDKKRIEDTKGGLLEGSYRWILENSDFQRWRDDHQSRMLWIKGDPGKGKTMLLCGIINELSKSISQTDQLSYFFCQATDSRINNATAVLRGLLYLLVSQQPYLVSYIQKKYDHSGKALFKDANAWVALCEIFTNILQDPSFNSTYFAVDALDECVTDQTKLLDFIISISSLSPRVKWIVSSRNEAHIERRLQLDDSGIRLSLELKENAAQISRAVDVYIDYCLSELHDIKHDQLLKSSVREKMQQKANGTFLWVSLVFRELKEAMAWEVLKILEEVPTELKDVYHRMVQQIKQLKRQYPKLCRQVLSTVLATYRPLHLQELHVLSGLPTQVQDVNQATSAIVNLCGSFLTIREDNVYLIHQSARDFLSEARLDLVPSGIGNFHHSIFSRSLRIMSKTLRRDLYRLGAPGYPVEQIEPPNPDPLEASRYSCIYWIDHLCDWNVTSSAEDKVDLHDGGALHSFLKQRYLYWLEALSICKSMSKGVVSMAKLKGLIQGRGDAPALNELVEDARRFIMYHKMAIEKSPLQAYTSALLFSPTQSLIRGFFIGEEPNWITIKPAVDKRWSPCLQTLEGHGKGVSSVVFSHNSTRLASASFDSTIKIWDTSSGECLQTLKGHGGVVRSVSFSCDSMRLASASYDSTIKIWDTSSGECLQTLEGYGDVVRSVVFSNNSTRLISASGDSTVRYWDAHSGECVKTLEEPCYELRSLVLSHDSTRLALVSMYRHNTIKILDASSATCLQTLEGCYPVAFSHNSDRLVSWSNVNLVKIWDASSGRCLQVLKDHPTEIYAVAFSHDSTRLASGSGEGTVCIWDASSGQCLQILDGHTNAVTSVTFSHDSAQLVSGSYDGMVKLWDVNNSEKFLNHEDYKMHVTSIAFSHDSARLALALSDIKIWDANSDECLQTLDGNGSHINSMAFSHDSSRLVSGADDHTVKVWDIGRGECLLTLEGHTSHILSVSFSHDSAWLASASSTIDDHMVKIWDASSGDCVQTFEGHKDIDRLYYYLVGSVVFSHDSSQVAFASYNSTIELWNPAGGECIQNLKGHSGLVTSMAFSSDSARLASSSYDDMIKLWDLSSGRCLQTLSIGRALDSISFGANDSCLHTDIGTIRIDAFKSLRLLLTETEPENPQYQGLYLSADAAWIRSNTDKLFWIPPEYRSSLSAVSGNSVFLAAGPRGFLMCKVQI